MKLFKSNFRRLPMPTLKCRITPLPADLTSQRSDEGFLTTHLCEMSSPGVKSVEKQKGLSKSPTHSTPERPPSQNKFSKPTMSTSEPDSPELFSWLRVFKLADLMTKQGC
ncbi:hypothetical protein RR46_05585 [Papilio xuthus]|uniref:Uncharacterized protein n=2 Tax=Papilio xuthus TaxID=66420 RepID=A0A194PVE9_PAPXU|nr:hypothetical protein RR46_05585 [Papilio xuthus]